MSDLRVTFVVRSFAPRNESGSIRCTAFARFLPANGIDTTVFCAEVEHASTAGTAVAIDPDWQDISSVSAIDRVPWSLPRPRGLSLRRLPLGATWIKRAARKAFVDQTLPALLRHIDRHQPDVLFASCAPPEALLLARAASRATGIPYLVDLRDPWSHVSACPYRHFLDFLMEKYLEQAVLKDAVAVVVPARRSGDLLRDHLGVAGERIHVVPNGYLEEELMEREAPGDIDEDQLLIVHSGELNVGLGTPTRFGRIKRLLGFDHDPLRAKLATRSPEGFLAVLDRLLCERPELKDRIRVAFTGLHLDRLPRAIESFPHAGVLLPHGRISAARAHGLMARADLLLLMVTSYFHNGQEYCVTIPAKTYSYLRLGTPVLAPVLSSEMKALFTDFPQVTTVSPDAHGEMAAALLDWIEKGRQAGGSELPTCPAVLAPYDRRETAATLARVLRGLPLPIREPAAAGWSAGQTG